MVLKPFFQMRAFIRYTLMIITYNILTARSNKNRSVKKTPLICSTIFDQIAGCFETRLSQFLLLSGSRPLHILPQGLKHVHNLDK
jgi:hypothetical protein